MAAERSPVVVETASPETCAYAVETVRAAGLESTWRRPRVNVVKTEPLQAEWGQPVAKAAAPRVCVGESRDRESSEPRGFREGRIVRPLAGRLPAEVFLYAPGCCTMRPTPRRCSRRRTSSFGTSSTTTRRARRSTIGPAGSPISRCSSFAKRPRGIAASSALRWWRRRRRRPNRSSTRPTSGEAWRAAWRNCGGTTKPSCSAAISRGQRRQTVAESMGRSVQERGRACTASARRSGVHRADDRRGGPSMSREEGKITRELEELDGRRV